MAQRRRSSPLLPRLRFDSATATAVSGGQTVQLSSISVFYTDTGELHVTGLDLPPGFADRMPVAVQFTTPNGWSVSIPRCVVNHREVSFGAPSSGAFEAMAPDLEAQQGQIADGDTVTLRQILTTIAFGADDMRVVGQAGVRPVVTFTPTDLAGLTVVRARVPQVPRATGYIEVVDSYTATQTRWPDVINRLRALMNLTANDFVGLPILYIAGPKGKRLVLRAIYKETGNRESIFPITWPQALSRLVNSTYEQYVTLEGAFDFPRLFHYYIMMRNTGYPENKYILGSVFMEGLKHCYAKNYRGYKKYGGSWKKPVALRKDPKDKTYRFKELVEEIYAEFGIQHGDTSFVDYRNEVIHQGEISSITNFPDLRKSATALEVTIEHTILKMLHYDGEYADRATGKWVEFRTIPV